MSFRKTFMVGLMAFLGLAVPATAQPAATAIKNPQPTVTPGANPGSESKMGMEELQKESQRLSDDYVRLQEHFNKIMQIKDTTQLKFEMAKHQDMMTAYGNRLKSYDKLWGKAMESKGREHSNMPPPQIPKAKLMTPGQTQTGAMKSEEPKKDSPKTTEIPKLVAPKVEKKTDNQAGGK